MNSEEIENYKKAGKVAGEVREFARNYAKDGMKLLDIAEKLEEMILEKGAKIAFPINLSLNEIAAHATPLPNEETTAHGLLKIDIGANVNGYIGDTALTVDLTKDKEFESQMKFNAGLLQVAKEVINPEIKIGEIGTTISEKIESQNKENNTNFTIISGLTGHALDKDEIHASPSIPNYTNESRKELKNTAFAVEPFVTSGSGVIFEGDGGGIYMLQSDNSVRDRDARKVLEFIKENYKTNPFCERWLVKAGFKRTRYTLKLLIDSGAVHHFPLLIEKTKSPVSQMEHTFVITDDKVFCTTDV